MTPITTRAGRAQCWYSGRFPVKWSPSKYSLSILRLTEKTKFPEVKLKKIGKTKKHYFVCFKNSCCIKVTTSNWIQLPFDFKLHFLRNSSKMTSLQWLKWTRSDQQCKNCSFILIIELERIKYDSIYPFERISKLRRYVFVTSA